MKLSAHGRRIRVIMKNLLTLGASLVVAGLMCGCARMHSYTLAGPTGVLTESTALEKARNALERDGHNPSEWRLTRANYPPSSDPNGVEDVFFERFNAGAGRVHFTNGEKFISYRVTLEGDRVVCARFRGL
jgi:hypothetical protein